MREREKGEKRGGEKERVKAIRTDRMRKNNSQTPGVSVKTNNGKINIQIYGELIFSASSLFAHRNASKRKHNDEERKRCVQALLQNIMQRKRWKKRKELNVSHTRTHLKND